MATDTTVNNLIINVLSKEQYDGIAQKSATELYLVPDDTETVKSVSVNGSTYTPDSTGDIDLGTISGGSGGSGEANIIESVKVNGTALTVTNKAVDISAVTSFNGSTGAITYTAPVTSVNNKTGVVVLNSDNIKYDTGSSWQFFGDGDSLSTCLENLDDAITDNYVTYDSTNKKFTVGMSGSPANLVTAAQIVADGGGIASHQSIKTVNNNTITGTGNVSVGTITGITMNGASKGTSGVVDLGTVITSHQDISGKADDSSVVHKAGTETITGDKTFSGQVLFDSGNPVYYLGDNMVRGDVYITNLESGATNVQITTDNNNDNRVVVKASETGFSWIQASNGTLDLQSVLDAKAPAEYAYATANENYVAIGDSINQCITELDDAINNKVDASDIVKVYSGSSTPSNSLGSNGDIYIKTDVSA